MELVSKQKQRYSRVYHTIILALLTGCISIGFFSCSKSESELETLARDMANLPNSYMEEAVQIEVNGTYYHVTEKYTGVPVKIKAKSTESVVRATIEPSLVDQYNSMFSESNKSLPEGAFSTSNDGEFTVPANEETATDSLYVKLADADALMDSTVYLVPVRLQADNDAELTTSVVFFKVLVTKSGIYGQLTGGELAETTASLSSKGYDIFAVIGYDDFVANDSYILKVPVALSRKFEAQDLHIVAKVYSDQEVLNNYNEWNTVFPQGTISLDKGLINIPAGQLTGTEELEVSFKKKELFAERNVYTLLLTVEQDDSDAMSVSPVNNVQKNIYVNVYLY